MILLTRVRPPPPFVLVVSRGKKVAHSTRWPAGYPQVHHLILWVFVAVLVEEGAYLLDAPLGNRGHLLHSGSLLCLQEFSGPPNVLECHPIRGYLWLSNSGMSGYAFSVTLQAGS